MEARKVEKFVGSVLENMPADWLNLTTHRLDIYNESLAKTEFLRQLEMLFQSGDVSPSALEALPTAYDYIRLGHPLSCLMEWSVAKRSGIPSDHVIGFSSKTTPILAILRRNLLSKRKTLIAYTDKLPTCFDADLVRRVYGYTFELMKVEDVSAIPAFDGSTVLISEHKSISEVDLGTKVDFFVSLHSHLGSILVVSGDANASYIADIQHVRRRETIAMTPADCLTALQGRGASSDTLAAEANKASVLKSVASITQAGTPALVASSGLSMQYAIMMGIIDDAQQHHAGKAIKIVVPPNCYGGTNDQARRVAACNQNVDIVDLHVDGDSDMVQSIDAVLHAIAKEDAVAYIIAEIPTNPRVEVPDLRKLKAVLSRERKTAAGDTAVPPVFILDQTFCPNVHFLGEGEVLSTVRSVSYVSGSKFPSGGRCTAGYCVGNQTAKGLMETIGAHLSLCDNEATDLQLEILAEQLPSMNQRIQGAYRNTRAFVEFIKETLPEAKINFVSRDLAEHGFTPSVFSLDLPTKGNTPEEQEAHKRALNLRLINLMITEIPDESKFCVSYGQLKGCYWTVPATSTQGTTKESDKDYIVRASLSPLMDLEMHKRVFLKFVQTI